MLVLGCVNWPQLGDKTSVAPPAAPSPHPTSSPPQNFPQTHLLNDFLARVDLPIFDNGVGMPAKGRGRSTPLPLRRRFWGWKGKKRGWEAQHPQGLRGRGWEQAQRGQDPALSPCCGGWKLLAPLRLRPPYLNMTASRSRGTVGSEERPLLGS